MSLGGPNEESNKGSNAVPNAGSDEVLLYTRAGCCLCDEAKQLLKDLSKKARFSLREVDIDEDPELQLRYNDEVPVIFIHGRKAFKYRIDAKQFLKRLDQGRR